MPPASNYSEPADAQDELVIKAIASVDRRRILDLLQDEPHTTGAICTKLPWLNRCTVMQHIAVLERARLIITRKEGRKRWNYLDVSPIQRFHERWIKALFNALRQFTEQAAERPGSALNYV